MSAERSEAGIAAMFGLVCFYNTSPGIKPRAGAASGPAARLQLRLLIMRFFFPALRKKGEGRGEVKGESETRLCAAPTRGNHEMVSPPEQQQCIIRIGYCVLTNPR